MTTTERPPAFEKFIQEVRAAWVKLPDTEACMKRVKALLEGLINEAELRT